MIALIVIAFALNFSLFASRVIVDAGNITANVFLTPISVSTDMEDGWFAFARAFYDDKNMEFKSVTGAFLSTLGVEGLVSKENFEAYRGKLVGKDAGER